jgi:hypothetical protein
LRLDAGQKDIQAMNRIHAFELEDQSWFPNLIRDAGTSYLRLAAERSGQAANIRPAVESALERSGAKQIVDLCSGGAGPVLAIADGLEVGGENVRVTLTDLYPNQGARELTESSDRSWACYEADPVDACTVTRDRPGLRTLFNAFHHFRPEDARRLLANAVEAREPILIVEVLQRRALAILGLLFAPLVVLLAVPFLRPFRPAWLPLTYLVPIIPLFVGWDGVISCLRIYDRDQLLELAQSADPEGLFEWRVEELPMRPAPIPGISLVGVPRERLNEGR